MNGRGKKRQLQGRRDMDGRTKKRHEWTPTSNSVLCSELFTSRSFECGSDTVWGYQKTYQLFLRIYIEINCGGFICTLTILPLIISILTIL